MKKCINYFLFITIVLSLNIYNVYACGEIKNLQSSVGTVSKVGENDYVVTVPTGTSSVKLSAESDYDFLEGFGPRTVSTKSAVKIRVDGEKCGSGIRTHIINFKFEDKKVEEPKPEANPNEEVNNNQQAPETDDNKEEENITTPNEKVEESNTNTNENEGENNTEKNEEEVKEVSPSLSKLEIEDYEIRFDPNWLTYEIKVPEELESIKITAEPTNTDDKVYISNTANSLPENDNADVLVTVEDGEGNKTEYVISVIKRELSANNFLSALAVDGATLNFDSSITNYTILIDKVDYLSLNALPQDDTAEILVLDNSDLKDGSEVIIRVTAENGETRDYTILVNFNFNIMDYWMYIAGGAGLLLIIIIIIIINVNKKKKKKAPAPEDMHIEEKTAGQINTIDTVSSTPSTPASTPDSLIIENNGPAELEMINPTNVEAKKEVSENTEVFKL